MTAATQNRFSTAVHELGPGFAQRATAQDRSGEFVSENYTQLKARKLISAGVPADLGGGGASHDELCDMLRTLGQYCPSTALALSMHTHLVAGATWRHRQGQPTAPLLSKVAAAEVVLVSTGANDWLDSTGKAEKVDGGFKVTGLKRFASGSPAGDIALTSAPYDDPQAGKTVLHFSVPLKADGVRVGTDWDTMGMRATGSHTLSFENVFVSDAQVSVRRPAGQWHPSFNVVCIVAVPIYFSAYVGLAEQAAQLARDSARKRPGDPHLPYLLGEMENALLIAQMALREMLAVSKNYEFAAENAPANQTLMCKTIGANAIRLVLDKAVEASGGGAYFRANPLERLWRDAQAIQFHPMPEMKQLQFTGRLAMGLPPI